VVKKKSLSLLRQERKLLIVPNHNISLRSQCKLLNVNRSGLYYVRKEETAYNLELMHRIDEQYTKTPFYGVPRMTVYLRSLGYKINEKRIYRLMKLMAISAVYAKKKISVANKENKVYPYLLKDLEIIRPNHVWSTDITYIRLSSGFIYLVAIIDWFSRFVLSFKLSQSLEIAFCVKALNEALEKFKPDIFNTDQGSQFTSKEFTDLLQANRIRISMDGKGRCFDNIFIERLWRTIKYEEVYLHSYNNIEEAYNYLHKYLSFYNYERPHQSLGYQSLGYKTPYEIFSKNGR
jgi:putative transposase